MEKNDGKFSQCDCGRMVQIIANDRTVRVIEVSENSAGDDLDIYKGEKCPTCGSKATNPMTRESWFFEWFKKVRILIKGILN